MTRSRLCRWCKGHRRTVYAGASGLRTWIFLVCDTCDTATFCKPSSKDRP